MSILDSEQYHGFHSARAEAAFGNVCVYESVSGGDVVGEVYCTVVGTPGWIAENYKWSDCVDLGPVGKWLRNEVTDAKQKAASDQLFGFTSSYSDPGEQLDRIDRVLTVCQLVSSGTSWREAIRMAVMPTGVN